MAASRFAWPSARSWRSFTHDVVLCLLNALLLRHSNPHAISVALVPPPDFIASHPSFERDEYSGVRVSLEASLATARLPFHVDVNVGDPIWPEPTNVTLPRLLGGSINVLGYPIAMVLTEKLVTAALRGAANTRWRDYADIYLLTRAHELVASEVYDSYRRVAAHRRVDLVSLRGLLTGFADAGQRRWAAWRERQRLDDRLSEVFADVVDHVITFADGCLHALPHGDSATWSPDACRWTATS